MLAIVATHPIQYQTPIWQALAADGRVPFEVWYLTDFGTRPDLDVEFGKSFQWDIATLSGYRYRFLAGGEGISPTSFLSCRLRERLRNRLSSLQAKALWIQGWQVAGYWQAVREACAAGAQVWLRAESNDLRRTARWKKPIKRAALSCLFSHIDRFFYIGSANRRLYQRFGVPESKLLAGFYAVDNERFAKQAASMRDQRDALRRQWGINRDAFCVLFCGKFIRKKRPLDLVRAAESLRNGRMPDIHLLFAGAGELSDVLRGATHPVFDAEAQASPDVRPGFGPPPASFVGFLNQTEISRAYVAADCLVLPSDHDETWGLVVNEAMASGLPCIVSDACGCAEDMIEPQWRFPVGDVAALADRLVAMRKAKGAVPTRRLPAFEDLVGTIAQAYAAITTRH